MIWQNVYAIHVRVAREQSQLHACMAMSYRDCTLCYSDVYLKPVAFVLQ